MTEYKVVWGGVGSGRWVLTDRPGAVHRHPKRQILIEVKEDGMFTIQNTDKKFDRFADALRVAQAQVVAGILIGERG